MNLRRACVALSTGLLTAVAIAGAVTPVHAAPVPPIVVPVPAPPTVTAAGLGIAVPSGSTTTITATVTGAAESDVVVAGIKTEDGWVEVGRELVDPLGEYTFTVTPPVLGPNVYRVGVLRDEKLIAYSGPVRVVGAIAVNPNPVVKDTEVTLSGVLPTAVRRPVGLQVQTPNGGWRLYDADFSAADGSVSFVETAPRSATVRFVAPARTIGDVDYPALASAPVDVTVVDAPVPAAR